MRNNLTLDTSGMKVKKELLMRLELEPIKKANQKQEKHTKQNRNRKEEQEKSNTSVMKPRFNKQLTQYRF